MTMFQNFNVKCIYLHIKLYICTDHYSYMYRMLKFVIFRLLVDEQVYHGYLTLDSLLYEENKVLFLVNQVSKKLSPLK